MYTAEALLRVDELARPAELCGFLLCWSGAPQQIQRTAQKLLAEVAQRLPADDLAMAMQRGRAQSPAEIVARVMGVAGPVAETDRPVAEP